MSAGDAVAPAGHTRLILLLVLFIFILIVILLLVAILILAPAPLVGPGVGEVGVEPLILLQEVVVDDGRGAVGDDQAVVQLGGLVVQQNADPSHQDAS